MSAEAPVLSTLEYAADRESLSIDAQENQVPGHWYFVPGRRLRNDGVSLLTLHPYQAYRLARDETGWLVSAEHERPHRYLVDDAQDYVSSLPGTDGQIMLETGRDYEIAQDGVFGVWRVRERVTETA